MRRGAANGASIRPAISSDGRFVAFQSDASDLIASEDINLLWDVFVFDRTTGRIVRVSDDPAEASPPHRRSDKKNDFDLYVATLNEKGDGPLGPPPH